MSEGVVDASNRDALMAQARGNFLTFAEAVGKDDNGRRIRMAPVQVSLVAHVQYCWARNKGALINIMLAHGKSTVIAVLLPLHILNENVNNRIKIVSATDELARDRVGAIRGYMDDDADFRECCPHVRPSRIDAAVQTRKLMWARHKLYIQRPGRSPDASIEAKGVLASGVGGRASHILFDDPVDEKNSQSEVMRKRVKNAYEKIWMGRLESKGRWAMISTPYHHEDLNADLRKNSEVCTLVESISDDFNRIDFKVFNAPDRDHPLMALV